MTEIPKIRNLDEVRHEIIASDIVEERNDLSVSHQRSIVVEAFDEHSAESEVKRSLGEATIINSLKQIFAGKKGFLGIGKTPNKYEAEVIQYDFIKALYQSEGTFGGTQIFSNGKFKFGANDILLTVTDDESKASFVAIKRNSMEINRLINTLLKHPDPIFRKTAAILLGQIKDERAIGALVQALKDNDSHVRKKVALCLGNAWNNKNVALQKLGHIEEANVAFTKAKELKYKNASSGD